ncbi:trypsin-like peptidase domain-containing protein [bacterium]|nr:trypsin-like peptidase domain-containing protein [bacterium]
MTIPELAWFGSAVVAVLCLGMASVRLGFRIGAWILARRNRYDPLAANRLVNFRSLNTLQECSVKLIVLLDNGLGCGNGFFAHPDGYVMTCAHCVPDDVRRILVITAQYEVFEAVVVTVDRYRDCALLRLECASDVFPYLALGTSLSLHVGQSYFLSGWDPEWRVGFIRPGIDDIGENSFTVPFRDTGIIAGPRIYPHIFVGLHSYERFALLEFYGFGKPGYSGSPIWDPRSKTVVGLLNSDPYGDDVRSGAVAVESLHILMRTAGVPSGRRGRKRPRKTNAPAVRGGLLLELFFYDRTSFPPEAWSRAVEYWPDLFLSYLARGTAYLGTGQLCLAEQDGRRAVELAPEQAEARKFLSKTLCQQANALNRGMETCREDLDRAEVIAKEAFRLSTTPVGDASLTEALFCLLSVLKTQMHLRLAEPIEAAKVCRKALGLFKDHTALVSGNHVLRDILKILVMVELRPEVDQLLGMGQAEAALARVTELSVELGPFGGTPSLWEEFARIHLHQGHMSAVIADYYCAIYQECASSFEAERLRGELTKTLIRLEGTSQAAGPGL